MPAGPWAAIISHWSAAEVHDIDSTLARILIWIAFYLLLILAPFGILLIGERPAGGGFSWDFALALGYAGFAMMAVQFWLTARFKRASAPFGIDILYYFHRWLAVVGVLVLLLHLGVIVLDHRDSLGPLSLLAMPAYLAAGWVALLAFLALLVTSLWRRPLGIAYDRWRRWHLLLAVLGMAAALWHVEGSGYYLADPLKRVLWTVFGLFFVALAIYVRLWRPWRLQRHPYRVESVRRLPGRTWLLRLLPQRGACLDYRAGQFAWLSLRASPFALAEHPFSFASSPSDRRGIEFAIKELGDFTSTIGEIQPGEVVYVDGPYGSFSVDQHPEAEGLVLVAGGVGIAPILSVLRDLADRGERRPIWLFYGNRRMDRVVFREQLTGLRGRLDLDIIEVLSEPPDDWSGERGFINREVLERHLPAARSGLHAFVCGPEPMIRLVERSFGELGLPLSRVHSEIFDLA